MEEGHLAGEGNTALLLPPPAHAILLRQPNLGKYIAVMYVFIYIYMYVCMYVCKCKIMANNMLEMYYSVHYYIDYDESH